MTLEDLIEFLCDECAEQTLTPMHIRRAVLLAYQMGINAGISGALLHPDDVVAQINAREAQSLEALRRGVEEQAP